MVGEASAEDVLEVVNGRADVARVAEAALTADVAGLLTSVQVASVQLTVI